MNKSINASERHTTCCGLPLEKCQKYGGLRMMPTTCSVWAVS